MKLPIPGAVADRVTLFSGAMGGIAVGLAYVLAFELTARRATAAIAALTLAFGTIFWAQATEAEVYTTEMAFMLGAVLLLFRWQRTRKDRDLLLACFVYTQGFGVHLQMIALLPVFVATVLTTDRRVLWRPRLVAAVAALVLLGIAPYAVCYFQDWPNELLAWGSGRERTFGEYINTVMGDGFQAWAFDYSSAEILTDRLPHFIWIWNREWMVPGLVLTAFGVTPLFRAEPRRAFLISIAALSLALFGMNYRVPDSEVFILPTWPFVVPFVAAGLTALADFAQDRWARGGRAILGAALFGLWIKARFTYPSIAEDHTTYQPMRAAVAAIEPGSVVVNSIPPFATQEALNYLFFGEKNLWAKGVEYLVPRAALGKEARHRTGDPDVVIPAAQARNAAFYVRHTPESVATRCLPRILDVGLDDIVKSMDDGDFLVVARGPGGITNPSDAYALRQVGLSRVPRTGLYAGIGCKKTSCAHAEVSPGRFRAGVLREYDTSSHLLFVEEEPQHGTRYAPVDIAVHWQMGNPYPHVEVDGENPFVHYQRPIKIGLPNRYKSLDGRDFAELSSFDTGAASLALVLDGNSGAIKQRYWQASSTTPTDGTLFSFDRVGAFCRSQVQAFDHGGVIDFGDPSARAYMGGTFIADYNGADVSSTAPIGSDVTLYVPFKAPRGAYTLTIRGRSNPLMSLDSQTDVSINGQTIGAMTFRSWDVRSLAIPAGLLRAGSNEIRLHFPELKKHIWGGPRRIRRKELSIALDALRVTPVAPRGKSIVDYLSPEDAMEGFSSLTLLDTVVGFQITSAANLSVAHDPGSASEHTLHIWARRAIGYPPHPLEVHVNGTQVGVLDPETHLKAFRFAVPSTALRAGQNAVRIAPRPRNEYVIPTIDPVLEVQRLEFLSELSAGDQLDALEIAAFGQNFGTADPRPGGLVECEQQCRLPLPIRAPGRYRAILTVRQALQSWSNESLPVSFTADGKGPKQFLDEQLVEVEIPFEASGKPPELLFEGKSGFAIRDLRIESP